MIKVDKKKIIIIHMVLLGIFVVIYNCIWFNKSFTLSEGWTKFCVELIKEGKVPYKDFYYYLPPLGLIEDAILWKLSFGYFIVFRFWRLLQRVLVIELVYYLLIKRVEPTIALFGCMITTLLLSANVYDLVGDYNQTQQLLFVLMCWTLFKYADYTDANNAKRYIWTFVAGAIGGLMFLQKQTGAVAGFVSYGLLLLILCFIKYEKVVLKTIASIVGGVLVTVLPVFLYFIIKGGLNDYIYQVYKDTSSKGTPLDVLFFKLIETVRLNLPFLLICLIIILLDRYFIIYKVRALKTIYIIIIAIYIKDFLNEYLNLFLNIQFINKKDFLYSLYQDANIFNWMPQILTFIFLGIIVWIIYHLIVSRGKYDIKAFVVAFSAFGAGYSTIMNNSESRVITISAILLVPAGVYLAFKDVEIKKKGEKLLGIFPLVLFLIACVPQKMICSYSWWGDSEAPIWEKTETVNIKCLKGFKFSKEEKKKYEKISELIDYYTDESSVIWGFPYVKVYNIFLDNYNMSGEVPVLFYDVCADDYASNEVMSLIGNEPDIVVWTDIEDCMEVHEMAFREGKRLGQRDIQKWFSDVKDTDYTLIGQVDNVFVYKLNDGIEVDKTFISRKTAKNMTAIYSSSKSKSTYPFEGKGTVDNPYQISSAKDLNKLRDLTNKGESFAGKVFIQTDDIDLNGETRWKPIGADDDAPFEGIYNGNGHSIKSLNILVEEKDVGLFANLNGTVLNLNVENAWVGGENTGIIAGKGSGVVLNCCVSGTLKGYMGGGVAFNVGYVENSLALVNLDELPMGSGVSGYYTCTINNNYSNYADGIDEDSGDVIDENTLENLNDYVDDYNKKHDIKLLHWKFENNTFMLEKTVEGDIKK